MEITERDATRNQITFDYDGAQVVLSGLKTITRDYANISGALEDVAKGQLMGIVGSTGKLVVCKSGASDGSQFPVGIMLDELTDVAIGGTVDNVTIANGGLIDEAKVVCDGTDTLDTVVSNRRLRDWLITNGNDIRFATVTDGSSFDN